MPLPIEQFAKRIEDSGILDGDTLKDFLPPKSNLKDGEELARELVRKKKLSKYQAEELYKGKGKSLVLGNYIIKEKLGAGGMGQVFKAEHRRMKRDVAIKLLPPGMMKDPAVVARFEREVTAAAKLNHPNIVTAFDADKVNDAHFLVMECVEGSDLAAIVKKNGPFPADQAVNYILQAARGLEAAHAEGIVHRDIKPANLLLDKKGVVKILDMGLARIGGDAGQADLTSTGTVMGTVDYMAPEQALNTKAADARADIYSLGCSLYYLLTGKATYGGDTLMAKLLAHREQPIPSLREACPGVPEPLEAVFTKMVAKKVDNRYQTISEVIADLSRLASGQTPHPNPQQSSGSFADTGLTDFLRDASLAPAAATTRRKTAFDNEWISKNKRLLQIGGGALGAVFLLVGIVISFRTKQGTLVVTVSEPDAEVQVLTEEDKVEITRPGEKGPLTIGVDPGKHRLKVRKDGFEIFTDNFEIKSGDKTAITARLKPEKGKADVAEKQKNPWPADAVAFGSRWFKLYSEHLEWHAARKKCQELGGRLAEARSKADNDFLVKLTFGSPSDGIWLGATDEKQEGRWVWEDGSELSYVNWADRQPNNAGPDQEHYLMLLVATQTGKWWDQPNRSGYGLPEGWKVGYICEWDDPAKPSAKSASHNEPGWVSLFNGRDLTGWKTHPEDRAKWEVKDGILVGSGPGLGHLFTQRDDFVNFHFRIEAKINDFGNGGQYFRTEFQKAFPPGYEAQINSTHGDPAKTGTLYSRATITEMLVKPDEWFTQEVIAAGNHIRILVNGKQVVDHVDANNTYTKGHLALQHHQAWQGHDTVVEFRKIEVKELPGSSPQTGPAAFAALQGTWVADDRAEEVNGKPMPEITEKRFVLSDRKLIMTRKNNGVQGKYEGTFTADAASGHFDFTGVGPGGGAVSWRGIYKLAGDSLTLCYKYVKDGSTERPTEFKTDDKAGTPFVMVRLRRDLQSTTPKSPPQDAVVFEGHAYKFLPEVLTWHQAKSRCEEMGGHLPIVTSAAEDAFLMQLAKKGISQPGNDGVWLGGTDEQKEGDWRWIDGKPFEFNEWGPGQPNNKENNEHYLMLYLAGGNWSDQPAKSVQHTVYFICEWDTAK